MPEANIRDQWSVTKIQLGKSKKILAIREGKTLINTISKPQPTVKIPPPFYLKEKEELRKIKSKPQTRYIPLVLPSLANKLMPQSVQPSIIRPTPPQQQKQLHKQKEPKKQILQITPKSPLYIITPTQIQPQKPKQRQRTTPMFPFPYPSRSQPIQPTTPTTKQRQILEEIFPKEPPLKPRFAYPSFRKKPDRKKEPTEPKSAFSWKGNVPEFQIEGVYKKYDIIYGEKRIAKLLKQEQFGKPKRKAKKQYDILGFPKTKKAKSSKWAF